MGIEAVAAQTSCLWGGPASYLSLKRDARQGTRCPYRLKACAAI